ncbi:MAG TPA: FG-GAP-like repeat-containing protein, partial [Herpetosiphonaceae bacterium]|nr:FG-GAP-like repeat-containing protein [Herpetosiphonaceae bacterium]
APTQRAVAAEAEALLADDLNADCRPDLAYVTPSGVSTLLQGPGGALAPSLILPFANVGMADLAAGDLNYDGQPDLAALRGTGSSTRQLDLFTMRRGVLAAKQDRAVADGGFAAHSVAIGDVTNDGRADLVVGAGGNMPEALINIFAQNADGTLPTAPRTLDAWHIPEAVAVADINHDGYNDIVALHSGWLALTVYPGSADGPLSAYDTYTLPYSTAYRPEALALGDLNGDGGLDVLIADGERGATYLINSAGAPRSSITAPADCGVVRSSAFTITGVLTNATELEVSLDGGRTWEAATVDGTSWEYKATLGAEWVYPVIMARGRNGDRVQAPAATRRMVFQHQRLALPIVIKQ